MTVAKVRALAAQAWLPRGAHEVITLGLAGYAMVVGVMDIVQGPLTRMQGVFVLGFAAIALLQLAAFRVWPNSRWVAVSAWVIGGGWGLHRFYLGSRLNGWAMFALPAFAVLLMAVGLAWSELQFRLQFRAPVLNIAFLVNIIEFFPIRWGTLPLVVGSPLAAFIFLPFMLMIRSLAPVFLLILTIIGGWLVYELGWLTALALRRRANL